MKAIVAGAVVIAILLLVTAFVMLSLPASPAITVRLVKSFRFGNATSATLEITNHVSSKFEINFQDVEARTGSIWIKCLDLGLQPSVLVDPNSLESRTFQMTIQMTNLPNGLPLRMTLSSSKVLTGIDGLFKRLELRFRYGQKNFPLNPFDKNSQVFSTSPQFLSVDFVEQETK